MFHNLDNFDKRVRARVEKVVAVAEKFGDRGIVAWAVRAAEDAAVLGRIRDKDIKTLERLEDTYGHEFYRNSNSGAHVHA